MVIASQRDYIITEEIARLALTQALQNHGYSVTTAVLESGMQYFVSSAVVARLGIAGVAVYALLPQQYGPYIVNTYDYVFGTYSQYWANPANWPSSQPQLWVDLGNACAASPSSQLLPMPAGPQITTQTQTTTATQTAEVIFIYRLAGNNRQIRPQDFRLTRETDYKTGLSFTIVEPALPHGKFRVSRLRERYEVRIDGGQLIYELFTGVPYIVDGVHRSFSRDHATVYLLNQVAWDAWREADRQNVGTSNSSPQAHDLFALREID